MLVKIERQHQLRFRVHPGLCMRPISGARPRELYVPASWAGSHSRPKKSPPRAGWYCAQTISSISRRLGPLSRLRDRVTSAFKREPSARIDATHHFVRAIVARQQRRQLELLASRRLRLKSTGSV